MQRLFVAIDLPKGVKTELGHLCSGISGAKWVSQKQMHLTLRFIGDSTTSQTEALQAGLANIKAAPFAFSLAGVGQFPPRGSARVIWVGMDAPLALIALQKQVEQTIVKCGFACEDRAFSPHITLARFRTPPPDMQLQVFLTTHSHYRSELIPVDQLVLYASELTPQGTIYKRLERFTLSAE